MSFRPFPSIEGFANVVKNRRRESFLEDDVISYRPKIKLHGTNAGIRVKDGVVTAQSRSRDIRVGDDNFGFAAFVELTKDFWSDLNNLVVFGEWAGPGIQQNDAITKIPVRSFFIFAVLDLETMLFETNPETLNMLFSSPAYNINIIPWADKEINIDYSSNNHLTEVANTISMKAEQVGLLDPYVKDLFDIEGPGEGYVYMPTTPVLYDKWGRYVFKAKAEHHRVRQTKAAASVSFELNDSTVGFSKSFITDARCEQAITEGCEGQTDIRRMSDFLKWIGGDIKKESVAELEAMGLEWKAISSIVAKEAAGWYKKKCHAC